MAVAVAFAAGFAVAWLVRLGMHPAAQGALTAAGSGMCGAGSAGSGLVQVHRLPRPVVPVRAVRSVAAADRASAAERLATGTGAAARDGNAAQGAAAEVTRLEQKLQTARDKLALARAHRLPAGRIPHDFGVAARRRES